MTPLVLVTIAHAIGIAVGHAARVPWPVACGVGAAGAVALLAAWHAQRWVGTAALVAAAAAGVLSLAAARPRVSPEILGAWTVEAEVAATPERADGTTRVLVALRALERDG